MNFKVRMKDYVKYNPKTYQLEIDKEFINESTSNLKLAQQRLDFYQSEKQKLD